MNLNPKSYFLDTLDDLNRHAVKMVRPHAWSQPISWSPVMAGTAQPFHKSITGYDMSSDKPIAPAIIPMNKRTSSDVFIFFIV
jgi:hypothetical protein